LRAALAAAGKDTRIAINVCSEAIRTKNEDASKLEAVTDGLKHALTCTASYTAKLDELAPTLGGANAASPKGRRCSSWHGRTHPADRGALRERREVSRSKLKRPISAHKINSDRARSIFVGAACPEKLVGRVIATFSTIDPAHHAGDGYVPNRERFRQYHNILKDSRPE
jgi:hypothetical protein